jgi:tetratricopeptide (TPR) repeat protein
MALIVLGIFLMLVNFNWTSIKSKFPIEVAPSQRMSWKIAFDSLKSRPLGFGLENFGIAYDKFKPSNIANTAFFQIRFSDSASEAANMATEGGILMILAILSLFWFYGRGLVSRLRGKVIDGGEGGKMWATGLGLLVALFLYVFNMTLLTVLILFLALSEIYRRREAMTGEVTVNLESSAKYSFAGSLAFIAGLVLVLVAGYFTVNNYISNVYLARALGSTDRTKAIGYFVESANSNAKDTQALRLLSQTVVAQLASDLQAGPKKDETKESYNARIQNQITSAINISLQASNVDPADSQNWANRGLIYQNLMTLVGGADQAAVNMYNESLKRNPADPLTYLRIGNVYLAAADNLRNLINNPPPDQAGKIDYAAARKQADDNMAKAEENFKKAISLYDNYGQALYNLAAVYDREGRLPEAIKQFEKLQAANQQDPSILFQLGLLYYRNNQKDNAFNAWQRAVYLFPDYSNARWYLSLVYEERGDLASALSQVEEIAKLNPDSEQVQQRLAQLKAGQRTIPPEKVLNKKPL